MTFFSIRVFIITISTVIFFTDYTVSADLKTEDVACFTTAALLAPTNYVATYAVSTNKKKLQQKTVIALNFLRIINELLVVYKEQESIESFRLGRVGLTYSNMALSLYGLAESLHEYIVQDEVVELKEFSKPALAGKLVLPLLESLAGCIIALTDVKKTSNEEVYCYFLSKFFKNISHGGSELLDCSIEQRFKIAVILSELLATSYTCALLVNKPISLGLSDQQNTSNVQLKEQLSNNNQSNNSNVQNVVNSQVVLESPEESKKRLQLEEFDAQGFNLLRLNVEQGFMSLEEAIDMRNQILVIDREEILRYLLYHSQQNVDPVLQNYALELHNGVLAGTIAYQQAGVQMVRNRDLRHLENFNLDLYTDVINNRLNHQQFMLRYRQLENEQHEAAHLAAMEALRNDQLNFILQYNPDIYASVVDGSRSIDDALLNTRQVILMDNMRRDRYGEPQIWPEELNRF